MPKLDLPAFVKIIQDYAPDFDKQEAAFLLVINSINDQPYAIGNGCVERFDSKRISNILSYKFPIPNGTLSASAKPEAIAEVLSYFEEKVIPEINPNMIYDAIAATIKLINDDVTISNKQREVLLAFEDESLGAFFGHAFLYALGHTNANKKELSKISDAPLLAEANFLCPLCHKPLVDTVKGKSIKRYVLTPIYPSGLNKKKAEEFTRLYQAPKNLKSPANYIALDPDCSENYLAEPSPEEYAHLMRVKSELARNYNATSKLNGITLDEEIRSVVSSICDLASEDTLIKLSYDALHVEEKIGSSNQILLRKIQMDVALYYVYIENLFSNSDTDFDLICSQVKLASQTLESAELSESEIFNRLSDWFLNHSQLGEKSKLACEIVVSFFIQNCEVFSK